LPPVPPLGGGAGAESGEAVGLLDGLLLGACVGEAAGGEAAGGEAAGGEAAGGEAVGLLDGLLLGAGVGEAAGGDAAGWVPPAAFTHTHGGTHTCTRTE